MAHPERIVPDDTEPGIVATHLKRYEFALPFCESMDVLDAACGVGYGSAFLADVARTVVGVDVSVETIEYARSRYGRPNVDFRAMDLHRLELPDASFGAACSFETIEHLADPPRAVAELARVLRDEGTLIASTPRAGRTTDAPANPYHRFEWAPDDFRALLEGSFADVELYGQRRRQSAAHRLAQRLDVLGLRRRLRPLQRAAVLLRTAPTALMTLDDIVIQPGVTATASEVVAVCRRPRR